MTLFFPLIDSDLQHVHFLGKPWDTVNIEPFTTTLVFWISISMYKRSSWEKAWTQELLTCWKGVNWYVEKSPGKKSAIATWRAFFVKFYEKFLPPKSRKSIDRLRYLGWVPSMYSCLVNSMADEHKGLKINSAFRNKCTMFIFWILHDFDRPSKGQE